MKVSISQALKNVASEKYNKQNIFLFFILILITGLIYFLLPVKLQDPEVMRKLIPNELIALITSPKTTIISIASFILSLLISGFTITAANNAVNEREEICLNPFTNISKIFINGAKVYVGSLIVFTLIFIITAILTFAFTYLAQITNTLSNPAILTILVVLLFLLVLTMVHTCLCVHLKFCMTLKFKDYFSFKSSWIMIANNIRRYGSYIGKSLLLSMPFIIFGLIFGLIYDFIPVVMKISPIGLMATAINQSINILLTLIISIIICLFAMYDIDLTAQLLTPIARKEKEEIAQE